MKLSNIFKNIIFKQKDIINTQNDIISRQDDFLNKVYPIGSIYISVNNTSPSTLFGGTWEQVKDTFLLSSGDTYTAGATGGEATHTLTVNEMPSHTHTFKKPVLVYHTSGDGTIPSGSYDVWIGSDRAGTNQNQVNDTGSNQAHNTKPPYLVVDMWKRTS